MPTPLLIEAVQKLARARSLADVTGVIRATARTLVGADGVTFVLRDNEQCHYVDEDAIGPLWKGRRFPLKSCITGWVMLNQRATVIPDIYLDDRIPHDAYRPTFVKSLAAVPIRSIDPIGAIGAYWAQPHHATESEVSTLQILADASAIALENVRLLGDLASANAEATRQADEISRGAERLRDALDAGKMSTWEWDLITGEVTGSGGHSPFGNGDRTHQPYAIPSLLDRVHPDDRAAFDEAVRRSRAGGVTFEHEFRILRTDGDTRWVRATGRLLNGDRPARIAGVFQDITEHRGLMLELARAQKIESIGRLAGGVAHDFNNALTAIIGSVELARQQAGPLGDRVESAFASIETAAQHAAALTRQLLTFARKQVLEPKVVNLNDLVTTATTMISRLLTENIVVRTTLGPELWRIRVDPEQVIQVIVNLAVNARDAMPKGGRLTFATANVDIGPRDAHHHPGITPGRYVMLSVRDTGVGMDQTIQKYIFEPFFTTKGAGQGTGLGLATVHGIVKQHGGHIWVYSEPGMGSIFKIFFPESRDSMVETKPDAAHQIHSGTGTILLVEDEPLVRNIAALTLRAAGYQVVEAADGDAAVRAARDLSRGPDVLVTDIVMPGISGTEVAEILSKLFPNLCTIFTSGYSEESALAPGSLGPRTAFLPKPYTLSSLTRAVQEIVAPRQASSN